jgi:HlyD family secretion protein
MNRKQLSTVVFITAIILTIIIYQRTKSVSVDAVQIAYASIEQYVDDTGTVKAKQSQTVYLERGGRITWLKVAENDRVRQGDLLLKISPVNLELANVALEQARINYEAARKDWERAQSLFHEGVISKTEYEKADTAFGIAAATLQSVQLELEQQQENLLVRAPIAGVVLKKEVELNQVVSPGAEAFVIGASHQLEVEADILADDVVKVRPGNMVEISGQATGGAVLQGVVAKVAPMARNIVSSLGVNQKRATVTIDFTGDTGLLKPGYDVDVRIITQIKPEAITVPLSAIFDIQGKNHCFVIDNGRTRLREVQIGIENDEQVEVIAGLEVGERVLVKPDNNMKEGIKVSAK